MRKFCGIMLVVFLTNLTALLIDWGASTPSSRVFSIIMYIVLGIIGLVVLLFINQILVMKIVKLDTNLAFSTLKLSGLLIVAFQIINLIAYFIYKDVVNIPVLVINLIYGIAYHWMFKVNAIDGR